MQALTVKASRFIYSRIVVNDKRRYVTKKIFTLPNLITAMGLVAVSIYGYYVVVDPTRLFVFMMLSVLIIISDALDGVVADKFDQHSHLGKIMDPLRDRAFTAVLLWHFFALNTSQLLKVLIWIIVFIELSILLVYYVRKLKEVRWLGKMRFIAQWVLLIFCLLFKQIMSETFFVSLLFIVVLMSLLALFAYCFD